MRRPNIQLCLLAICVLLGLSLWFAVSAVGAEIEKAWGLTSGQVAWLTMAVQLGFVLGTLVSAIFNLPDRISAQWLMATSAALGSVANALIVFCVSDQFGATPVGYYSVLGLRIAIGMTMAGIYPPGMKLVASWFKVKRGFAIGVLVGALTLGSVTPHLLLALPLADWLGQFNAQMPVWRLELIVVSGAAAVSALIAAVAIRPGPVLPKAARFDWKYFYRIWLNEPLRRANFGYLGHQWELYAMWTWIPVLLATSCGQAGWDPGLARWLSFVVIGVGGAGCVLGGRLSDKIGRCSTTVLSLVTSGVCCLFAGFLVSQPYLLTGVCLVWGFAVIADSAQFSTAISELSNPELVGPALTVQTCVGFLLTMATIRLVPFLQGEVGWGLAIATLALGPVFGIWHMSRLRRMPEAAKMAGGQG